MSTYTNRLANETSPYLLQHAHNPVNWYPWGKEAFEKARMENKPILVSIGYAACHWCHVMERESFEDPEVAALMNEHFVNIKVDREERPDVDHIYMDAVQAISGSGGWPLNAFLTPQGKPFYGGTYFPPKRAFNRASWTEILLAVAKAYQEKKEEIEVQAENLTQHLAASNSFGISAPSGDFQQQQIDLAFENIMKNADKAWGGFGRAPKFPQTFTILFLLRYARLKGNDAARAQAVLSLDKMAQGGLYEHVGGGFARYSTDTEWLVPHFEKMLYDNALLVMAFAEAYQLTQEERFKEIIKETLDFAEREMRHPEGGFFSALDADSEGEEGRFYVWDYEEVKELLGADAELFCKYFNIRKDGNWEGKNILHTTASLADFAREHGMEAAELEQVVASGKAILLEARGNRVRPLLDDKVILSWNALMNLAYAKAYAATGEEHYREVAQSNMRFLLNAFYHENQWHHTWKEGQARHPAFLDDHACLIAALTELAQITAEYHWLRQAEALTRLALEHYAETDSPFFLYTHQHQQDILLRKKEVYDGATPSGNALMAHNLYRLGVLLDNEDWRQRATDMLSSLSDVVVKYPTSFGVWLSLLFEMVEGTHEIAVVGPEYVNSLKQVLALYLPHKLIMATDKENNDFPLLKEKYGSPVLLYLCKNYSCQKPVATIEEFMAMLG